MMSIYSFFTSKQHAGIIRNICDGAKLSRQVVRLIDFDRPIPPGLKLVVRSTALLGVARIPLAFHSLCEASTCLYQEINIKNSYNCALKVAGIFYLVAQTLNGLRSIRAISDTCFVWVKRISISVKVTFAILKSLEIFYRVMEHNVTKKKTLNLPELIKASQINTKKRKDYSLYSIPFLKATGRIVKRSLHLPCLGQEMITSANAIGLYIRLLA